MPSLKTPALISNYDDIDDYRDIGLSFLHKLYEQSKENDFCNCWLLKKFLDRCPNWLVENPARKYHRLDSRCYHISLPGKRAAEAPFNMKLSVTLPLIIEYAPTDPCESEEKNIMLKVLRKYLPADVNGGWIPFDMDKRRELYPKAFEELKQYMPSSGAVTESMEEKGRKKNDERGSGSNEE